MTDHAAITDPNVHEPKGASTASANTGYFSDGAGSGTWKKAGVDNIDYTALLAAIQTDINDGDLDLKGYVFLTGVIADVSTASSILFAVPESLTVVSASVVLGGTIDTANAVISFKNSAGASMGSNITVLYASSLKGDQYAFTASGNNVLTGPTWFEVATDGASGQTIPLYVTVKCAKVLN